MFNGQNTGFRRLKVNIFALISRIQVKWTPDRPNQTR